MLEAGVNCDPVLTDPHRLRVPPTEEDAKQQRSSRCIKTVAVVFHRWKKIEERQRRDGIIYSRISALEVKKQSIRASSAERGSPPR